MNSCRTLAFAAATTAAALLALSSPTQAQISINVGVQPDCPYGYFEYPPYACAPYGYYGPDWFLNGIFVGAGPWFHGGPGFRGHVDNRFDPHHGYRGPVPRVGERRVPRNRVDRMARFHGNEIHNGHGRPG